jgi:hypothetical protein
MDCTEVDIIYIPARQADKMMVMFVVPAEKVVELAVRMGDLGDNVSIRKLLQIPVYCWKTDAVELSFHLSPDFFGAQITRLFHEYLNDGNSLGRHFKVQLFQRFSEFFAHTCFHEQIEFISI